MVMKRLSQNDDDTAGRVDEVCDSGTSVKSGELVDDTRHWRPMVDDGVEASERNQKGRRGPNYARYLRTRCRGTNDNTITRHG